MDKDPKQVILFVLIFLPGFICLTIARSIVDLTFTEFEFIYVAVALSIGIFSLSLFAGHLVGRIPKRMGETDDDYMQRRVRNSRRTTFASIVPVTVAVAWIVGIAVQNDWVTNAMRLITPTEILKKYRGHPQYVVFKSHHDCKMWNHDSRPADIIGADGKEIKYPPTHKNWVRIRGDKAGVYEGFPETFQISGKESEYYLSPACRVMKSESGTEVVTPVPGPGVLVLGKDILSIEFIDTRDSACFFQYYQTKETEACPDPP